LDSPLPLGMYPGSLASNENLGVSILACLGHIPFAHHTLYASAIQLGLTLKPQSFIFIGLPPYSPALVSLVSLLFSLTKPLLPHDMHFVDISHCYNASHNTTMPSFVATSV